MTTSLQQTWTRLDMVARAAKISATDSSGPVLMRQIVELLSDTAKLAVVEHARRSGLQVPPLKDLRVTEIRNGSRDDVAARRVLLGLPGDPAFRVEVWVPTSVVESAGIDILRP